MAYGIQQCNIPFSVLTIIYVLLFSDSREDEKSHPLFGESYFLCMGRTDLCSADAVFYHSRLYKRPTHRKDPRDQESYDPIGSFCSDQSACALLF